MSAARKGRPNFHNRGPLHPLWKGGNAREQQRDRKSPGYQTWRRFVRERADGLCESCQQSHPRRMHAHHIKRFATHPELRLDPDNGVWLCDDCHGEVHA